MLSDAPTSAMLTTFDGNTPNSGIVVPQPAASTMPKRARVFSSKPRLEARATASGAISTARPEAAGMMKPSSMPATAIPAAIPK